MRKAFLFLFSMSFFFALSFLFSKPAFAQAGTVGIVDAVLDNTAGTINMTVTVHFMDKFGEFPISPKTITVSKGTTYHFYSDLDTGNYYPYSITWGTSCSDPTAAAAYAGTWGDGVGPGVAAYQTDPQDVHCRTPNATPAISSTSCAAMGWSLGGVGPDGANIDHFEVFISQTSSQVGPGDPTIGPIASVGSGSRSYNFGSSGKNGTYYVRVRAVSPQGVGSWSSVGSFNCSSTVIAPASLSGVFVSCNGSGSGNIVNAAFGWTPASGGTFNQQWLDYSVWPNNFAPGTYTGVNVGVGNSTYTTGGLAQGVTYYWRINTQASDGNWYTSPTATFVTPTCPVGTSPTPVPTATPTPGPTCPAGCTPPPAVSFSWGATQNYVGAVASTIFGPVSGNCSSTGNSCSITGVFPANWPVLYNVYVNSLSGPTLVQNGSTTTDGTGKATFNWSMYYNVEYCAVADNTATSCPSGSPEFPTFFTTASISNPAPSQWYHVTIWEPCDPSVAGCNGGMQGLNTNYKSNPCNCPTPTPTPFVPPAQITLTGFSDCTDGVNPKVHLTWTSNTQSPNYIVFRDGVNQATLGNVRSWDSGAQPSGAHNWMVQGTAGVNPATNSNTVSITTATCSPPPADPSNLIATTACDASGNPTVTFRWKNNANNESGYWLDVSHDAFTGPSSTTASPSVWGVKSVLTTVGPGTTVQFLWNNTATSNTQGQLDNGDVDSAVGGNQLAPEKNVTYYWRVKAYSADRQSNHVYPNSTDGSSDTTTPPGVSFTAPNCNFDLQVTNAPGGNVQVYQPGDSITFKVQVTNTAAAQAAFPGGNLGAWTQSNSPSINCPSSGVAPSGANTQSVAIPWLAINSSATLTLAPFTAPSAPGTYFAYFYALPTCSPVNDNNWTNNSFQLTYAVSAKAWFETTNGGDVGARGNIQVANPTIPAGHFQSTAALVGNPLNSSVVGQWELNNYTNHLFPADNGSVFNYFKSRFYQKITGSANSYNKCGGPMVVTNGSNGLVDGTPVADNFYYCTGDLTLQGDGNLFHMVVPANHSYVVYVGGNLNIKDDGTRHVGPLTAGGTSIVFLVQGNINVDTNILRTDGVYIAGGAFSDFDTSTGTIGPQLQIYGAVFANTFNLGRVLSSLPICGVSCDNTQTPADLVFYQPKYLVALSQMIGSPAINWKEVAP